MTEVEILELFEELMTIDMITRPKLEYQEASVQIGLMCDSHISTYAY